MNIRLRSAQSRREALRTGRIAYLGAGLERHATAEDLNARPQVVDAMPEQCAVSGLGNDTFQTDGRDKTP